MSALQVLRIEPPPRDDLILLIPSGNCTEVKCQVEGGRAGWAIGKGNNLSDDYHQLRSLTDAEETIFSLKMVAKFFGNYSELSICGTEDMDKTIIVVACFAYNGFMQPSFSKSLTIEIYNGEVEPLNTKCIV